jgi:alkylhydroperoxidase family enzyme
MSTPTGSVPDLPLVDRDRLPAALRAQVERLESLDADTTFHRYVAHSGPTATFYWQDFYQSLFYSGRLAVRIKEVVRLSLAALSGCTFCRAGDIDAARRQGLTDAEIGTLLALDPSGLPERDQVAVDLALRLSPFADERPMTEADWTRLRDHFRDEEVAELLIVTSVLAGVGRMLSTAGFIPRYCEIPAPPEGADR